MVTISPFPGGSIRRHAVARAQPSAKRRRRRPVPCVAARRGIGNERRPRAQHFRCHAEVRARRPRAFTRATAQAEPGEADPSEYEHACSGTPLGGGVLSSPCRPGADPSCNWNGSPRRRDPRRKGSAGIVPPAPSVVGLEAGGGDYKSLRPPASRPWKRRRPRLEKLPISGRNRPDPAACRTAKVEQAGNRREEPL